MGGHGRVGQFNDNRDSCVHGIYAVDAPPPAESLRLGRELFSSRTGFGQQPTLDPHNAGQRLACADCHRGPAFTDGRTHLVGPTEDRDVVLRQTPHLLFLNLAEPYGWDGRFPCLQAAIRAAILSPREMNATREPTLLELDALADFIRFLEAPPAVPGVDFDPVLAQMGSDLFGQYRGTDPSMDRSPFELIACTSCHIGPGGNDHGFHRQQVPGLVGRAPTADPGHVDNSGAIHGFNTPTLMGLRFTAPYFHDGSIGGVTGVAPPAVPMNTDARAALLELVNFYDARFTFGFTPLEKLALVEFLLSV